MTTKTKIRNSLAALAVSCHRPGLLRRDGHSRLAGADQGPDPG